jgi:hypothetical protein
MRKRTDRDFKKAVAKELKRQTTKGWGRIVRKQLLGPSRHKARERLGAHEQFAKDFFWWDEVL